MKDEVKWKITLNLLTLFPALARGIPAAYESFQSNLDKLKDGITQSEWTEADAMFYKEASDLLAKAKEADARKAAEA